MTVSELEFRSKLEDLMSVEELVFEPTPGFGRWRKFFPDDAVRHPAKANLNLIDFLIDKYTKVGDLILDPMAGTGSTCVLSALKGRDAICIDIEPLFYQWMEKAREIVEKTPMLGRKGKMINILGDARKLSDLLKQIDIIITSPPYAETISHKSGGPVKKIVNVGISTITARTYSYNPDNIGNLPLGVIDIIITSPPYAHEATASEPTKLELEGKFKMGHSKEVPYTDDDYRSWDKRFGGNIGKLKMFVRVPASPEEADYVDNRPERKGTLWEYTKEVLVTPENVAEIQGRKRLDRGRGETYVEAMMKVYNEMYKVLKPNGYAIVIIKPFIRNKQVIDLPYYTWLMMKRVGFKLEKIYKLRLETQSFWRVLYYKKYPDVPRINHEYIIIGRK